MRPDTRAGRRAAAAVGAGQLPRTGRQTRAPAVLALLAICLAGLPMQAWTAPGSTADQVAPLEAIATLAEAFRREGMRGAARLASEGFDPKLPGLSEPDHIDAVWASFFRSSAIFIADDADTAAVVGYYNPFADAWLITLWSSTEPEPGLRASAIRLGGTLAPQPMRAPGDRPDPRPRWLRDGAVLQALQRQSSDRAAAFTLGFAAGTGAPLEPDAIAATGAPALQRRLLYRRLGALEIGLRDVPGAAAMAAEMTRLLRPIAAEDWETVTTALDGLAEPDLLDTLRTLPRAARREFTPAAAIADGETALVFANDTGQGNVYVVFRFAYATEGQPLLQDVTVLDLFGGS